MINCPFCGNLIDSGEFICPYCGADLDEWLYGEDD
ncbi:MAG: hypothetical protein IKV87_01550 [Methanobrevibacter sp.]|nr:hypothetical protein [Methanobrevibacter sp.]